MYSTTSWLSTGSEKITTIFHDYNKILFFDYSNNDDYGNDNNKNGGKLSSYIYNGINSNGGGGGNGIKSVLINDDNNKDELFQKVKIETLEQFTKASCVEGSDFKNLKETLIQQLSDIPKFLKNKIYNSLIKSMSKSDNGRINDEEENFIHNITKIIKEPKGINNNNNNGNNKKSITYLYMVWWKIHYNSETMRTKFCLVIFGFTFETSPKLIGFIKRKTTKIIGDQPCKCGLWCEKCPILTEEYVEDPVYEQTNLSLEQYDLLNTWMLKKLKKTTFDLTNSEINKNKIKLLTNEQQQQQSQSQL